MDHYQFALLSIQVPSICGVGICAGRKFSGWFCSPHTDILTICKRVNCGLTCKVSKQVSKILKCTMDMDEPLTLLRLTSFHIQSHDQEGSISIT